MTGTTIHAAHAPGIQDDSWRDRGLCSQVGGELFFPEKGGSIREAKQLCHGCEVKNECLEWALAHDERFGVWGGVSERDRRALKKQRTGKNTG